MRMSGDVTMDIRYSFTAQFALAAASQSLEAFAIEAKLPTEVSESDETRHRGYVVGAIMQSVAALESEVWEVMVHGPGHHLGSNGTDVAAKAMLGPMADLIDRQDVLSRFATVLHVLGKPRLDTDGQVYENAALLVRLRNELVHYKSKWGSELESGKLIAAIKRKRHRRPPFRPATGVMFFPHHCLSAECAAWAAESSVAFLDHFYDRLGQPPRLAAYRHRLTARP